MNTKKRKKAQKKVRNNLQSFIYKYYIYNRITT